jgi:hypothetical protein
MGNTDIALPADTVTNTAGQMHGIPAVSTPQESRSVLKSELVINTSPCFCTLLPACVEDEMVSPLTVLPALLAYDKQEGGTTD